MFILVALYFGHPSMKYFVMLAYSARFFMVIIWGWIICMNTDFRIGTAIGTEDPALLGSYYVRFITVRDSIIIPLSIIISIISYLAKTEPEDVKKDLLKFCPCLKCCLGGGGAVVVVAAGGGEEPPKEEEPVVVAAPVPEPEPSEKPPSE